MLRIRLRRVGAKKQPVYRVVVADRSAPRDGRFVETIGYYNPRTDPIEYRVEEERALHWLSKGAQPSEAVERLLRKKGTLDRFARLRAGVPLETLLAEVERKPEAESQEGDATVVAAIVEEPEEGPTIAEEATDAEENGEAEST